MKKQWISIKRGFIRDPKHRIAMGECVWLFQYMIDIADWDTGTIHEWKDEAASDDMQMPIRTLREQRRKLESLDYIICSQRQYGQEIKITNWTNPREYSGEVYNPRQGDRKTSPSENGQGYTQGYTQGYIQGDTQGSTQDVTPTYIPNNQIPNSLSPSEIEKANKKVDYILETSRQPATWRGRELVPPHLLVYADWWNQKTGQEMKKKVNTEWLKAFTEWDNNELDISSLEEAYTIDVEWKKVISKPSEITSKAIAIQALPKKEQPAPRPANAEDDEDLEFVPAPMVNR